MKEKCKNWIRRVFKRYPSIEINLFRKMAAEAGYSNGVLSDAITESNLKLTAVFGNENNFLYHTWRI